MNETVKLLLLVPFAVALFVYLFKRAKKVDIFQAKVKIYMQEIHPEILIIKQFGFGFTLKIGNKTCTA